MTNGYIGSKEQVDGREVSGRIVCCGVLKINWKRKLGGQSACLCVNLRIGPD